MEDYTVHPKTKSKAIGWVLHCENPDMSWNMLFDDYDDFDYNLDERLGWGECAGVTVYFSDGKKKKYPMVAWSA